MSTKGVSSVFIGQGITALLSLLFQILIARFLLPEGRGDYAVFVTYGSILVIATFLGNEFGLRYRYVNSLQSLDQTVSMLFFCVCIGLSFSIILVLFIRLFVAFDLMKTLLSLAMSYAFLFSRQLNVTLSLSKRFSTSAIALVLEESIRILLICLLFFLLACSIEGVFIASISASLLVSIWQLRKLNINRVTIPQLKDFYVTYIFGFKSLLYSFTNFSQIHVVVFILSIYLSSEQIGIFSIAIGLSSRISLLPDTFNRVIIPQLIGQKDENYLFKSISKLFYSLILLVAILLLINDHLIIILFGANYMGASLIFPSLLFAALAKSFSKPFEAYYSEFLGRAWFVSAVNALTLSISVLLLFFGLRYFTSSLAYNLYALGQFFSVILFLYINRRKLLHIFNICPSIIAVREFLKIR